MRFFLDIAVWLAVITGCIILLCAAVLASIMLIAVIHESSGGSPLFDSILVFCALVGCGIAALVLGHSIGETRRAK